MSKIVMRSREHFDAAMRRFKRAVETSGIPPQSRRRESYENPTAVNRHRKAIAAQDLPKKFF